MENLIIYPPSFHYDIWTVNNTTVSHITTHSVGLWHRQKKLSLFPMDLVAPLWERNLLLSSYNGTSSPSLILLYSGCGWTVARHGTRIKDHPSNLVSCLLQTIYIIYVQSTFWILWAHLIVEVAEVGSLELSILSSIFLFLLQPNGIWISLLMKAGCKGTILWKELYGNC